MNTSSLPSSADAERSILGAILLDNGAFSESAQSITPTDFSLDSHRRIYRRMAEMSAANTPIDPVTLIEELSKHRELEAVGDVGYVSGLLDGVPDRPSIAHYIRIVKEKSKLRCLIHAAETAIARAEQNEKPTDVAASLMDAILDVESQSLATNLITFHELMPEVLRELETESESGCLVGLPTGLGPLDEMTGGLRRGELVVVGALPGKGKTAFGCQIVAANAESGNPVAVFSAEMSRWDIGKRMLSAVGPIAALKIRNPSYMSSDDWPRLAESAALLRNWPAWLDDTGSIRINELLARARLLISRMGVKLIIVDHLQLIQADSRDVRERVSKVTEALRQLAKSERITVVLLSQLRRLQSVNDVPTMIDLKESGDIEAAAHVVLLLHTPECQDGSPTGEDLIVVGKNRNGPKGPIPAFFNRSTLKFYARTAVSQ